MPVPTGIRTLVLNDDYNPLNIVGWKRGIKRTFESLCDRCNGKGHIGGKQCNYCNGMGILPPAQVVEYYDLWIRDSKGREHAIPAVIANTHHIVRAFKNVPFSRPNVLKRDNYMCQYCGVALTPADLTLDHVIPRSMWAGNGTPTCFQNIVAACRPCNHKKANKTPEQAGMQLRKLVNGNWINYKYPKKPNYQEMVLGLSGRAIPKEWATYLEHILKSRQPS